jgi:hypothetical protein
MTRQPTVSGWGVKHGRLLVCRRPISLAGLGNPPGRDGSDVFRNDKGRQLSAPSVTRVAAQVSRLEKRTVVARAR